MANFPDRSARTGRSKVLLTAVLCLVSLQTVMADSVTAPASTLPGRSAEGSEVAPMEELIITATYRDTLLMNTPIAISALSSDDLEAKGVENLQTLFQSIPGMSYGSEGASYNTLSIRGLTAPTIGEPVVGVYIDNAPVTDASGGIGQILGNTFDLERIEVLKGPQGTLYGESNMGGSLRYITNKPDPDVFSYKLKAGVEQMAHSNDLSSTVQGVVNIPLLDHRLAARIAAAHRHRAGVLDAVAPRDKQDVDPETETSYRAAVLWDVTEDLALTLSGNWNSLNFSGPGVGFHCYTGATPLAPQGEVPAYAIGRVCPDDERANFNRHPYETHLAFDSFENGGFDDYRLYNFNVEWDVPFAQLTSSTTYFERETDFAQEFPPRAIQPLAFVNFIVPGANFQAGGPDGATARFNKRRTQELRAVSSEPGPFQWTAGVYFRDDHSRNGQHARCHDGGPAVYLTVNEHCWAQWGFDPNTPLAIQQAALRVLNSIVPGNTTFFDYTNASLYGEASYHFTDAWEFIVGLRESHTKIELTVGRPGQDSQSNPLQRLKLKDKSLSPKATIAWRPNDDWMTYFTYTEGFRPGVINAGLTERIEQLRPLIASNPIALGHFNELIDLRVTDGDKVYNYELGTKATVFEGRVNFALSLFNLDWKDTIVFANDSIDDVVGVNPFVYGFASNVGKAKAQGVELEVQFAVTDALRISMGGSYNWKSEIGKIASARFNGVAVEDGNRLPRSPKYNANVAVSYDFRLSGWDATARADAYATGSSFHDISNQRSAPAFHQFNLRLTARQDAWEVSAFIRNVTDEEIVLDFNDVGFRLGYPRSLGLEVAYVPQ